MLELLRQFSLETIFTFIILLSLAVKGGVSFFDWSFDRIKTFIYKNEEPKRLKNKIENHQERINDLRDSIKELSKKIDILLDSDRDDIKAYITSQHHYFCYQKGWIDDYTLDCIEKRYAHYKEENGNSFIGGLMGQLRALPKRPPTQDDKA